MCREKNLKQGNSVDTAPVYTDSPNLRQHTKPVLISYACPVMGDLKGLLAVHFNFYIQSFSLYVTFKSGIATGSDPIP